MKKNGQKWLDRNGEAISCAVMLAFFLALLLLFAAIAKAEGLDKKLPALGGLTRYGCEVNGPITQVDFSTPLSRTREVWKVTFWAEHKSIFAKEPRKDWKLLYAFRKKRKKGLADCDKFMDRVRAALKNETRRAEF